MKMLKKFLFVYGLLIVNACSNLNPYAVTVNGKIPAKQMSVTLVHEHVLVDFIGADKISGNRYDQDEAFTIILPHLKTLYKKGCRTLIECTPQYLGRDVVLLKRLSDSSGIQIFTNTGYYGASDEKFLPASLQNQNAEELAKSWIQEAREGINGTGIKPGFMKLGADDLPFSASILKILKAAAITHKATGLPIAVHTSKGGKPALEELRLLTEAGVPAEAWIWVHAQNEKDITFHLEAADKGGWVEFDGINNNNTEEYIAILHKLKAAKLLHRVLISQDAGWYNVGDAGGGNFRNYNSIFDSFVPALLNSGFTEKDIQLLLVENPAKAFRIRK
jgi:predicted metal-dependent phosphotriesterase family hydrolase